LTLKRWNGNHGKIYSKKNFDDKQVYILDCFDEFFDNLEDLWIFYDRKLIEFDDIYPTIEFYAQIMRHEEVRDIFESFMKKINLIIR
jgi:hypothetical protein